MFEGGHSLKRLVLGILSGLFCLMLSSCDVEPSADPPPVTPSPSPTQSEEQGGELTVFTDWSKLDERNEPLPPIGSRWYDGHTGELIVRDDYGPLIPYAGLRLMDGWPASTGCLYGLMTVDGVVVTDAVYYYVTRPCYYAGASARQIWYPLLALKTGISTDGEDGNQRGYLAIAASDGSWCTEFCYRGMSVGKDGLLLFDDGRISYMSPTGEILSTWTDTELGLTEEEIGSIIVGLEWGEGYFGLWFGDYFCLGFTSDVNEEVSLIHLPTGQKEIMARDAWDTIIQDSIAYEASMEEFSDSLTGLPPGDYYEINFMWDGFSDADVPALISARQYEADGTERVLLNGDIQLAEAAIGSRIWYYSARPVGGVIEVLDLDSASYYDIRTMDCVFRTYLGFEAD
jgi:hypothetical protein